MVCLGDQDIAVDITVLGFPSMAPPWCLVWSLRHPIGKQEAKSYILSCGFNPYDQGTKVIDCGDVRFLPY